MHGKLFRQFSSSGTYRQHFDKPPVICISVSTSKTYQRTGNRHPILGIEYRQSEFSSTDRYFEKMGMQVRFFMPPNGVAPLAFYFHGDLLNDYTNIELIGTISTMETFQKIYRPEIYNANSAAGMLYQPSLKNHDYSSTQIVYDREERSQLAVKQGKFAEQHFIKPYKNVLEQWAADFASHPPPCLPWHPIRGGPGKPSRSTPAIPLFDLKEFPDVRNLDRRQPAQARLAG